MTIYDLPADTTPESGLNLLRTSIVRRPEVGERAAEQNNITEETERMTHPHPPSG